MIHVGKKRGISRSSGGNAMIIVFMSFLGIVMFIPLLYTVLQSIKPMEEIFIYPPRFWVTRPTFSNFRNVVSLTENMWVPFSRYLFNSVFVTLISTTIQIILSSMAAYPLAKHDFFGKNFFFQLIVLALLFTADVLALPQYILISWLGWVDTYWALILPSGAYTLGVYLMRQNMIGFPDSILESARIDGASEAICFWKIIIPSMKSVWMTMIVFSFGAMWSRSDTTYIYTEQLKGLPTLLSQISASGIARQGVSAATSVSLIIPPILIFIITQSNVIESMANSGLKD